jgi:hypothetical protein
MTVMMMATEVDSLSCVDSFYESLTLCCTPLTLDVTKKTTMTTVFSARDCSLSFLHQSPKRSKETRADDLS